MANPNLLNITSVQLSSNTITLPADTASGSTYYNWTTSTSRLLLTNPAGSNRVIKITSMVGEHESSSTEVGGITVFTTAAGNTGAVGNVINTLYGANETQISRTIGGFGSGASSTTNRVSVYGAPNFGDPAYTGYTTGGGGSLNYPTVYHFAGARYSKICTPDMPYYLTEGFSLYGVNRVIETVNNSGTTYSTGLVTVRYSYEIIQ